MLREVDRHVVALEVNGEHAELLLPVHKTLLEVLREDMQLTGTKHGCELGAAQCGYCTPGILLAAKSLLESDPQPTRDGIREALAGNLCRCTGYSKILDAVELAGDRMTSSPPRGVAQSAGGDEEL